MSRAVPIDILYSILEHMDKRGLATLCRVNRIFKEVTESVLYHSIVMPLPEVSRVCAALSSERLAHHVRHFETSKKPGWKPRDARELLQLRNALRQMKRLRILRIHFGGPMAWILDGSSFPELQSMLCNLSCDHHLAEFFKRQTQLMDVTLSSIHSDHFPCSIHQSCLPKLRRISADPVWLAMLVPNHSIAEVDVWDFNESPWEIDWLSHSLTPVTRLSVSESFLLSRGPARVASLVPKLRYLRIKCATSNLFSDEEFEKRQEFTAWLSSSLAYFRFLDAFEVHFRGSLPILEDEDPLLQRFVMDASEHTVDLHDFVMTFARTSNSSHTQAVWHRIGEDWNRSR